MVPTPDTPVAPGVVGWVREVRVRPGDRVKAGAVVAALQAADDSASKVAGVYLSATQKLADARDSESSARNALAAAQADMAATQAKMAQASSDLASARRAVTDAGDDVSAATREEQERSVELARYRGLYKQGLIPRNDVQDVATAQSQTIARKDAAWNALTAAQSRMDLASARVDTQQRALADVGRSVAKARGAVGAVHRLVGVQQGVVDETRALLESVRRSDRSVLLVSPVSGTVSSVIAAPGILVTPAMAVAQIRPAGAATAVFDATDAEAGTMRSGMWAAVRISEAGNLLIGQVKAITPNVTGGEKRNAVLVEIRDPANVLKPGKRVLVRIALKKTNAVAIPQAALTPSKRGSVVWVESSGKAHCRAVDVVGFDKDTAMVGKGLQRGESVIFHAKSPLKEQCPVAPRRVRAVLPGG